MFILLLEILLESFISHFPNCGRVLVLLDFWYRSFGFYDWVFKVNFIAVFRFSRVRGEVKKLVLR